MYVTSKDKAGYASKAVSLAFATIVALAIASGVILIDVLNTAQTTEGTYGGIWTLTAIAMGIIAAAFVACTIRSLLKTGNRISVAYAGADRAQQLRTLSVTVHEAVMYAGMTVAMTSCSLVLLAFATEETGIKIMGNVVPAFAFAFCSIVPSVGALLCACVVWALASYNSYTFHRSACRAVSA
jgi:hypothetical protein